jgi:hypothetical protein
VKQSLSTKVWKVRGGLKGTIFIQSSHLTSIVIFHILLVIVIAKATHKCFYHPPLPFPDPRLAPFTGELHLVFCVWNTTSFSSHPETPRCIMQKPVNPINVACSNFTVFVAFVLSHIWTWV